MRVRFSYVAQKLETKLMNLLLIILGVVVMIAGGAYLLGRWICNIINETCKIDTEFNFEEDGSYLS